ncbi:DsbA family oxidoreductase [Pseudomonas sp. GL-B-19]|uniref:DsbA family oxidoreductase n=1 Tax=Pseudomonas sp. GL-B-19 TaxID=2832393 RepID=UPI001CC1B8E6|nr:DsbA family oxidoreductase [Pseudomonas sp. GL-B-19]
MSGRLRIDVFFDFICPWCLIGKRQLERALESLHSLQPEVLVTTVWHGVQLLPHIPVQGEPFAEFYLNRLGSAEAVAMRQAQVRQAAQAVGVPIDLSRIATMPNTADAHRLLAHANTRGSAAQRDLLLERLFAAYFQNGEDLGCRETLITIAQSCGYDADAVKDYLQDESGPFVGNEIGASSGVPSFQFDSQITMTGAQPAEVLLGAMYEALERQRMRSPS